MKLTPSLYNGTTYFLLTGPIYFSFQVKDNFNILPNDILVCIHTVTRFINSITVNFDILVDYFKAHLNFKKPQKSIKIVLSRYRIMENGRHFV